MADRTTESSDHSDSRELALAADASVVEPVVAAGSPGPKGPWWQKLWRKLTGTRKRLIISLLALLVVAGVVVAATPLKYAALGWLVPANIDITVTDGTSRQLLPGATVSLAGASVITDKTGTAHFTKLQPGATTLAVSKAAYTASQAAFTLSFGDQPVHNVSLTSSGIRINFKLTNYVSGQAVSGARVQLGDADVVSGSDGAVTASVSPENNGRDLPATITLDGFNALSASVKVVLGAPAVALKLVPAGQVYYLSNRSGHIDLYGSNLDGSGATVLLPGTGTEDESTGILPNVYDQSIIGLVSSRAGRRVSGNLVEDLYVFRPATKELTLVQASSSFGLFRTWLGKTLVYQKAGDDKGGRPTIEAYDPATNQNTTIAACTGDGACPNALYATDDFLVYALSGAPGSSSSNGLFVVKSGGTKSQQVSIIPASSTSRNVKNTLLLQYYSYSPGIVGVQHWQSLDLTSAKVSFLAQGPATVGTRTFVSSPGDKHTISVDLRDGQSDLYLTDASGGNEQQLTKTGSVSQFVQWFGDDYVAYSDKNTLYIESVAGGDPQKITNFYSGSVKVYGGGYNPNYY